MSLRRLLIVSCLLAPVTSSAQSPEPSAPAPCSAPEHRQFDFWIGEWEVKTPDGKLAGRSRIESILGGCVVLESWTGGQGMSGRSFNVWTARDRKWHQKWVDDRGQLLEFVGGIEDAAMVLRGRTLGRDGAPAQQRMSFEKRRDGTVRQLWQQSPDGSSWSTLFEGIYHKR